MKIGLRFKRVPRDESGYHPARGNIELYDITSGESLEGLQDIRIEYTVSGAIRVNADLLVAEVMAKGDPLG